MGQLARDYEQGAKSARGQRMIGKVKKHSHKLLRNIADNARYYLQYKKGQALPVSLSVELTNVCNANCVFCAYQYDKRKKTSLDEALFRKALAEFKTIGGRRVNLTPHLGELFVDRDIIRKLRYIKELGFKEVSTYTNASLLHHFGLEDLLRSGLTEILISTAPLWEDVYRKIYRNNNYQKVLNNISELLKTFRRLSDNHDPEMTVERIAIEFRSERSLPECAQSADFQKFVKPYLTSRIHLGNFNRYDAWSGVITPDQLIPGMTIKNAQFPKRLPCGRTSHIQVGVNGEVRLCGCRVDVNAAEDELTIGDIRKNSLKELYNSEKVRKIKDSFYANRLLDVCKKCSWYEF